MRGDFSAWNKDRSRNFRGTLHQQGRVLLDRDWNAQTEVFNEWQETAGRDAFGAGVAAIPAEVSESFKVTKAAKIAATASVPVHVEVSINKGRVWADGLLVESAQDLVRTATYINPPAGSAADLPNNLRDAVILESWLKELSPFQVPEQLIEPALGGVDTTERVQTAYRFRLYRMAAGETCDSIIPKLIDDFSLKGKLTAQLNPTVNIDGDCPVVESGGYTGFEHRLYRIEIAETDKPAPESWFKWSQCNGGLVGRGFFDATNNKVIIKANENAIVHSGINSFYLEAIEFNTALGIWRVIYGARNVALVADHTLTLPAAAADTFIGAIPSSPAGTEKTYFFRLWNGIERLSNFTAAAGTDLPDNLGIKLTFEPEAAGKYTPQDFWTFQVRAGEIGNPLLLVDNLPPQGIFYHRVPLAEVNWTGDTVTGDAIEDCRRIFQPLTKLKTCCTYRVGDGIHSHGDFTKIQDAINALPKEGGEVCILPGLYEENIVLKAPHNRGIILKGCGKRTVIRFKDDSPVIYVRESQNIRIESLAVESHENGFGILLEGKERAVSDGDAEKAKYLKDIVLSELHIAAARKCAIKAHTAQFLTLSRSNIEIKDVDTDSSGVYLAGDDMLIERNEIRVLSDRAVAAKTGDEYTNAPELFVPARLATGGLQVGGGSDRVRILHNLIVSGIGNGITLGRIDLEKDGKIVENHDPFGPKNDHIHDICNPDDGYTDDGDETDDGLIPVAGPPLFDIRIKFNRIFNMGRNGIGVATFFSMGKDFDPADLAAVGTLSARGIISVNKLIIDDNRIERCVNINPQPIPVKMTALMGYGGISLAHVENLVIRDNFITENGPSFLEPICGIYVLVVEGAEISRNHILNNGIRTQVIPTSSTVKNGARGGIWIGRALSPTVNIGKLSDGGKNVEGLPFASGIPAAKIQENIVTVPMGRSLTLFAQGAVSVVGNQFTSFSIQPVALDELIQILFSGQGITAGAMFQLLALLAGNVLIFDTGIAVFFPAQQQGFQSIRTHGVAMARREKDLEYARTSGASVQNRLKLFLTNGTVLFTNNQCHQNLLLPETSFAVASIFIASLDDVGFHNNQCDSDFQGDFMVMNALIFGITARITDNRFREVFSSVLWSAATFGLMNVTSDNESVHCLLVRGVLFLKRHNLVMLEMAGGVLGDVEKYTGTHPCDQYDQVLANFGI